MSGTKSIRTFHVRPRTLRRRLITAGVGGVIAMVALGLAQGEATKAHAIDPSFGDRPCVVTTVPPIGGGLR